MLILVGVSVTVSLNGGLFSIAKQATGDTENAIIEEQKLADGRIKIKGQWYESIEDYLNNNPITRGMELSQTTINLKKKETEETEEGEEVLTGLITASTFGMDEEPEITWEVSPGDQKAISLNVTTGKEITVTAVGTENATVVLTAKCTYEEKTYTETCTVNLEILIDPVKWTETTKPTEWGNNDKVKAMTEGTDVIPLPEGFAISRQITEDEISEGLVIKDSNNNEFVWIPVDSDFKETYAFDWNSRFSEPVELTSTKFFENGFDSQETLDRLYGQNYYDYDIDFAYASHYIEMVESVNKYNGFYIGRYETTIDDEGNIGSKVNTPLLRAIDTLKEETDSDGKKQKYYYKWWGLYDSQRTTDSVLGNGDYVQTTMIWGQQWEAMVRFLGNPEHLTAKGWMLQLSGMATYGGRKDLLNNIYDLRRNAYEWIAAAYEKDGYGCRVVAGDCYDLSGGYVDSYSFMLDTGPNSQTYACPHCGEERRSELDLLFISNKLCDLYRSSFVEIKKENSEIAQK